MSRRRTAARRQAGTAALETMVVMSFLFTIIFGFVHLCMFAVTKSMTNYAAFAASRALLVGANGADVELAARQVTSEIQWWPGGGAVQPVVIQRDQQGPAFRGGRRRRGTRVTFLLPFGYPIFQGGLGNVRAVGFAPTSTPHTSVPEEGDNR